MPKDLRVRVALATEIIRAAVDAGFRIGVAHAAPAAPAAPEKDDVLASAMERLTLAIMGDDAPTDLDVLCAVAHEHRAASEVGDAPLREAARALAVAVESSAVALDEHRTLAAAVLEEINR